MKKSIDYSSSENKSIFDKPMTQEEFLEEVKFNNHEVPIEDVEFIFYEGVPYQALMQASDFNRLWNGVIQKKADQILSKYPGLILKSNSSHAIYERYEFLRNPVRQLMKDKSGRIDCHKIASTLIKATLDFEPIVIPLQTSKSPEVNSLGSYNLVNEALAWHIGLSVLMSFMVKHCEEDNNLTLISHIKKNRNLQMPITRDDTYHDHVIRNLRRARITGDYDVFSFSHVLFLLEVFNYQYFILKEAALTK